MKNDICCVYRFLQSYLFRRHFYFLILYCNVPWVTGGSSRKSALQTFNASAFCCASDRFTFTRTYIMVGMCYFCVQFLLIWLLLCTFCYIRVFFIIVKKSFLFFQIPRCSTHHGPRWQRPDAVVCGVEPAQTPRTPPRLQVPALVLPALAPLVVIHGAARAPVSAALVPVVVTITLVVVGTAAIRSIRSKSIFDLYASYC